MEIIRPFSKLKKEDVAIAGGKGASLGELSQSKIPVPNGFVILSTSFDKFLEETDLNVELDAILDKINYREMQSVENASEEIKSLILNAKMPQEFEKEIQNDFKNLGAKFVAVRSSATSEDSSSAAWAGQLESYLNTTEENLIENVKKCWASLFTPRAIFYRKEKNLHKSKISVAVVVQKMVESDFSGIAFSVHPVTQDENQIIIEAGLGLGEAIVSGQITPDSYVIEKEPRRIIDKNVNFQERGLYRKESGGNEWKFISKENGEKQKLSDKEILELTEIILKIENHYSFPCDIEWAREKGKFYIVQSRPITTLSKEPKQETWILEKQHTRDYCLLKLSSWMYSDLEGLKKELGQPVENTVFYSNGKYVKVYYYSQSLQNIFSLIAEKSGSLNKVKEWEERFLEYYKKLEPYLKNKKEISSKEELKEFYNLYREFWTLLAIFFVIPLIPNIANEQKKIALRLREMTQEYSEANQIFMEGMKNIFNELSEEDLKLLLPEEVFNQKKIIKENIEKRKQGFIYHHNKVYTGEEIDKFIEEKNIEFDDEKLIEQSGDFLKGEIGFKGIVKGKARIIMTPKEIYKLKEGEILIAPMTTPDYIPAMKKASAFITDEGGITSHAAIVSRELKKPCVVGTKIATQLLSDGDEIEVDAEKGVVRILRKEKIIFDWWLSRPYPILQIEAYNGFLTDIAKEVGTKITYPIFMYSPETELVTLYYNMKELAPAIGDIGKKIMTDTKFKEEVFSGLTKVFEEIKPYFDRDKEINSFEEFKDFFILFKNYMKYVAYTWILPGLDFIPKGIKDEAMKLRESTEDYAGRRDSIMIDFANKIINNKKINPIFLSLAEIGKLPKNSEELTKERAQGFLYYKGEIVPNRKMDEFLKQNNFQVRDPPVESDSEIKGMTAQKGEVKGKVKIVYTEKELKKVSEGDILVTPMTRPEFIPAMKKAAAFVTDEGGVVCHAAIVSREMKKPCIVGVKIATKVLHDGDEVEVDANNGVVKILEKAGEKNKARKCGGIELDGEEKGRT